MSTRTTQLPVRGLDCWAVTSPATAASMKKTKVTIAVTLLRCVINNLLKRRKLGSTPRSESGTVAARSTFAGGTISGVDPVATAPGSDFVIHLGRHTASSYSTSNLNTVV